MRTRNLYHSGCPSLSFPTQSGNPILYEKRGFLMETFHVKGHEPWIPRRAENDSPLTLQVKRRRRKKGKQAKTHKEGKRETALIGPGGRQPRAERGRGLCERSEFRSPRARRRRPSEKARYRAAVLLGSFFSPKRRMNRNAPWKPRQSGERQSSLQAKKEKEEKGETSKDTQRGKKRNRPYRAGRAAAESGKRARTV